MSRKHLLVALAVLLCPLSVSATVEEVQQYLAPYCSESDNLQVQAYPNDDQGFYKTLFIKIDYSTDAETVLRHNDLEIIRDMVLQEWFDYDVVQLLLCPWNMYVGAVDFREYETDRGIARYYKSNTIRPLLVRQKEELDKDTKKFIGRVAQELLNYNNISASLNITGGGEDNLEYQVCYNLAIVTGTCENDGKTYNFLMEFTFQNTSEWVGTYDTICVILNDVTTYGEYIPIEDYQWKIFE